MTVYCDYCNKKLASVETRDIHYISCKVKTEKEGIHPILEDINKCPGGLLCFYCGIELGSDNAIKYHLLKSCPERKKVLKKKTDEDPEIVPTSFDQYCRDEFKRFRQKNKELEVQIDGLRKIIARLGRKHLQLKDFEHYDWFEEIEEAVHKGQINLLLFTYENDDEKYEQIQNVDDELNKVLGLVPRVIDEDIEDTYIGFSRDGEAILPRSERIELAKIYGLRPVDISSKEGVQRIMEAKRRAIKI